VRAARLQQNGAHGVTHPTTRGKKKTLRYGFNSFEDEDEDDPNLVIYGIAGPAGRL
jgi:hypothetical protein